MTTRIVISCDGTWPGNPPMPCRGSYPARTGIPELAVREATSAGWSLDVDGDLCPSHARATRDVGRAT